MRVQGQRQKQPEGRACLHLRLRRMLVGVCTPEWGARLQGVRHMPSAARPTCTQPLDAPELHRGLGPHRQPILHLHRLVRSGPRGRQHRGVKALRSGGACEHTRKHTCGHASCAQACSAAMNGHVGGVQAAGAACAPARGSGWATRMACGYACTMDPHAPPTHTTTHKLSCLPCTAPRKPHPRRQDALTDPVPCTLLAGGGCPLIFVFRYVVVNRDPATSMVYAGCPLDRWNNQDPMRRSAIFHGRRKVRWPCAGFTA